MEYELYHHGIKGMKWGVRRYQNADGSLTDEGKKRFVKGIKKSSKTWYGTRNTGKITDDIKDELEQQTPLKNQLRKLGELTDRAVKLESSAYEIKDSAKRRKALKTAEKAYDEYYRERDKLVDSLVGRYGDVKVSSYYAGMRIVSTGRQLVSEAVMKSSGWRVATKDDIVN